MVEYRTSESVGVGHPDKLCDRISDSLLDAVIAQDPMAKCAFEVMATPRGITISGETNSPVFRDELDGNDLFVHNVIRRVGYTPETLYPGGDFPIRWEVGSQSEEIAEAVIRNGSIHDLGAGDQGLMFGYADPTDNNFLPVQLRLAHLLAFRVCTHYDGLGPDAKTQVGIKVGSSGEMPAISKVLVSTMHREDLPVERVRASLRYSISRSTSLEREWAHGIGDADIMINPSGAWNVGGPVSDTGLTGRKVIVDTYGGAAPHGGGAFSGKDPSKVDRSAAYMARFLAKNVAAAIREWKATCPVLVTLSYSIGVREPFSFDVKLGNSASAESPDIRQAILDSVDLTPGGIIERLDLLKPRYEATSAYGHFGESLLNAEHIAEGSLVDRPWERIDPELQVALANAF